MQNSVGKIIKCLLLKALIVPSLYINNNRATEWGTICQRAESIFTRPTPCGRIHGTNWVSGALVGPLPVGPLAPPIVPCLCWSPPGTYLPTISPVLSSPGVHTQAPVLHNRTNAPPFSLARWGRTALEQNEPNRPNWMTGTYLHISQRPQLPVLFNFVFFAIVAHK